MKKFLCMLLSLMVFAAFGLTALAEGDVTLDIVSISPKFGIDTQSAISYKTTFGSVVCKCATTAGDIAWLHIDVENLKAYFDPDARLGTSEFSFADVTGLAEPVRVTGEQVKADDVAAGLAEAIGADHVISFAAAQVLSGVAVEEAAFAADVPVLKPVYAQIASIVPQYRLQAGDALQATNVVCAAKTADGADVYVAMSVKAYNEQIDETAVLGYFLSANEVKFDAPKTFHGVAVAADDVAKDFAKEIGTELVFCFGSME